MIIPIMHGIQENYMPNGVALGGSDYFTKASDFTGNADGKVGTIALFWKISDARSTRYFLDFGGHKFYVYYPGSFPSSSPQPVIIRGRNAADTTILSIQTDTTFQTTAAWHSILASWDLSTATAHLYLDDADDLSVTQTLTDDTIDYTASSHVIGARDGGTSAVDGELAEIYFNPTVAIDFSQAANRRKFISAGGVPINLGGNGSLPTGTAPLGYFSLRSETANDFASNLGTGGDLSVTGTPTVSGTKPAL